MIKLIKPSIKYKQSFLEAIAEFHKERRNKDIDSNQSPEQFAEFVRKLRNQEKGIDLPRGYVPASVYWLVNDGKFIGRVSVRHQLTTEKLRKENGHIGGEIRPSERRKGYGKKILELALKKASSIGIKKALVTCDEDNIGSWKVIEANKGILENKIKVKGNLIRRYWVTIKQK